jgi:autotransporter-associated beta strand protein
LIKTGAGTVILAAANSHTGGTVVAAGTAIIRNLAALGTGGLVVQTGATVRLEVGLDTIALPSLQLEAGATLDLGYGRVTLAAGGMTAAEVRSLIIAGRNGGTWSGAGITSSIAAANASWAVGYRTVGNGSIEIAWTALGDANLDGTVDAFDLVGMASGGGFGNGRATGWTEGDFTYDGVFNAFDLVVMQSTGHYGRGSYRPQLIAANTVSGSTTAALDPLFMFAALAQDADDE